MIKYVVGDIHGMFDKLEAIMKIITTTGPFGQIIFLGDYVDRGPDSKKVVDYLMKLNQSNPTGYICLKGNHEDLLLAALQDNVVNIWLMNGGGSTIDSYDGLINDEHVQWMKNLPTHYEDPYFYYVHAGVDPYKDFKDQIDEDKLWIRYPSGYKHEFSKTLIHGHSITRSGLPEVYGNRYMVDTGAFVADRPLCALVINEDKVIGYIDTNSKKLNHFPTKIDERIEIYIKKR